MAPAIGAFVVKLAASFVVSKIVGEITGSEFLGAVAGGVVGMGLNVNTTTGAVSWGTQAGAGAAGTAATTSPSTVAGGGQGLLSAGATEGVTGAGGGLATVAQGGTAVAPESFAGGVGGAAGGAGSGAGSAVAGGVSGAAGGTGGTTAGGIGGLLSKGAQFMEEHPVLTETVSKGIAAAMGSGAGETGLSVEEEKELLQEKARLEREGKEAVDVDAILGTSSVARRPSNIPTPRIGQQAVRPADTYTPQYMTRQSPNYENLLKQIYDQRTSEEPASANA